MVLGEISGEDIDEEDLVNETFKARIVKGRDQDGDPQINFKKFMAS